MDTYMEKLLGTCKTLIRAKADITTTRQGIAGQYSDDKRPLLNGWLKRMAKAAHHQQREHKSQSHNEPDYSGNSGNTRTRQNP